VRKTETSCIQSCDCRTLILIQPLLKAVKAQ